MGHQSSAVVHGDHLADDRQCDLLGPAAPEVETDGGVDAIDLLAVETRLQQALAGLAQASDALATMRATGGGSSLSVKLCVALAAQPFESVTVTVAWNVPWAPGGYMSVASAPLPTSVPGPVKA